MMLLQVILEGIGLGVLLILVCAIGIRKGAVGMVHLRPAPTAILEATPQNPVLQSAHFRQATFPPRRCRGRSTSPLFSAGKRIRRKGRCHGTAQSHRPNGLGAEDEQY